LKQVNRWIPGVVLVVVWGLFGVPAWGAEYIDREEWPAIQRGIQVTQYAKLARVVDELERTPNATLVILYPGGEAGQAWAMEIRDWLVALAIPARFVAMRPGSGVPGALGLQVERQGLKRLQ